MKMKLRRLLQAGIITIIVGFGLYLSYHLGDITGENRGFSMALDTVNKICGRQLKSDTTVSEVVFLNRDTNVYYLSRKTILGR